MNYAALKEGILKSYNILGIVLLFLAACLYFGKYGQCTNDDEAQFMLHVFGIGGVLTAAIVLFVSYYNDIDRQVKYILSMLLSYFLAAFLIYSAYRLLNGFNFLFYYSPLEEKIIDIDDRGLYHTLMSHLPMVQYVMAYILLFISGLLMIRNTRWIAAFALLPLMTIQAALQLSLESCSTAYYTLLTAIPLYLVFQQTDWFVTSIIQNKAVSKSYPFFTNPKVYEASLFIKLIFFIGILVHSHFKHQRLSGYLQATPITGVWKIDQASMQSDTNKEISSFLNAEALFFETGREAFIKNEEGLTRFKYLLDSAERQFEMYDFHEYRALDFKGRYELLDPNTLVFEGKNNNDTLSIKFVKDHSYDRLKKFDEVYTPTDYQFYLRQ